MKRLLMIPAVLFALGAGVAAANDVVVAPIFTPLVAPPPATTVFYGAVPAPVAQTTFFAPAPAMVAPAPVVVHRPVVVGPAPVVAFSPVAPTVTHFGSAPAPVVAFSPVAPAPVVAFSPVAAAPVWVPVGRPVVVRTTVFVPGQPVRNFFRAITP